MSIVHCVIKHFFHNTLYVLPISNEELNINLKSFLEDAGVNLQPGKKLNSEQEQRIRKVIIRKTVYDNNGHELTGSGITSYSKPIGFALSLLGFASKIKVNKEEIYVNNKSFCKFMLRNTKIEIPAGIKDQAIKLDELYHSKKPHINDSELDNALKIFKTSISKRDNEIKNLFLKNFSQPIG